MRDLHMHTVFSDGKNTPEEMVQEAIRLGLDTVGISDHSHLDPCGMTLESSAEYRAEIARLKEKYAGQIRVLCGLERDFISDDFADYDYVIGSVHLLTMPDGHHVSIDAGAITSLAHLRMHFVCEVEHGGPDWQLLQVAFWSENEDFIRFVYLSIRVLKRHQAWIFQHFTHVEQPLLRGLFLSFI